MSLHFLVFGATPSERPRKSHGGDELSPCMNILVLAEKSSTCPPEMESVDIAMGLRNTVLTRDGTHILFCATFSSRDDSVRDQGREDRR